MLERTSRRVTLTDAGAVLLSEARAILSAVTVAERGTRQAGQSRPRLVLAVKCGTAGDLLTELLDVYQAEPGAATVEVLLCEAHQHQEPLRSGKAGVALLYLPFDSVLGLDTESLCTEGQVAVLPAAHPLAGRTRLRVAEVTALPDLLMARWPDSGGGCPEGPGVEVKNLTQLFHLVALGRGTVIYTSLTNRPHPRRSTDELNIRRRRGEGPDRLLRGGTRKRALPLPARCPRVPSPQRSHQRMKVTPAARRHAVRPDRRTVT
ncbi:LysR substrate-binding domain-containing protein [Streptomyces sp. S465]|uniref:LysR substrate-binding domain-containing protein n=1 Tax=Streptomyces sp. S465 TaxID=2979468 RepID=UPI002E2F9316|nr:LysR substrate-binding domain-containing protein [Streptomyces sp. S465]